MMPCGGSSAGSVAYFTPGSTASIGAITLAHGKATGAPGGRAADLAVGGSARRPMRSRLVALGLAAAGVGMLPWLVYLAVSLPPDPVAWHWPAAWAGLDAMEAAGLMSTGLLMLRGDSRYRLAAIATAALLTADAWFDVTTAPPGSGELASLLMAALAELPAAAVCTWLAFAALRARRPSTLARPLQPVGSAPCGYWSSARAAASTRSPGRCPGTRPSRNYTPHLATPASPSWPTSTPSPRPSRRA